MSSLRLNWLYKVCSPWSVDRFNTQMRFEVHLPKKDNLDDASLRWYSNGSLIVPQGEMMNPVICSTSAHNEKWWEWDFYRENKSQRLSREKQLHFLLFSSNSNFKQKLAVSFIWPLFGTFRSFFWERESQRLESRLPETFWSFCDSPN